ncbi:MAG TPA: hypothetical protein VGO47_14750 [Chlamydiales bacterium]|jgi:hypothetical protein|nr:hypothetical protein [Chlamydiales bacterium]
MAQRIFPHNIISSRLNSSINTKQQSLVQLLTAPSAANDYINYFNSLVFHFPVETPVFIKQIFYSLAEVDGSTSTSRWSGQLVDIYSRLIVASGYNGELKNILIDPYFNRTNMRLTSEGGSMTAIVNGGNNPLDDFGRPIADIDADSSTILFEKQITSLRGNEPITFDPPIESEQNKSLTVILTPTYNNINAFWNSPNGDMSALFGAFAGGFNTGAGINYLSNLIERTLTVRGCYK